MKESNRRSDKNTIRLKIREANTTDSSQVVKLIKGLAKTTDEESPIDCDFVARYLESPRSTILIADRLGQIVGLLSYSLRPDLFHAADSCLIEELIVQSDHRNQGIGSALLQELFSRLADYGCAEVSLAVMPNNRDAIRFYRRLGLVEEALFLEKHFTSRNK